MLAIGRALMAKPRVLLLDEPTEGLAPIYVKLLFDLIADLRDSGLTVLIVEQNVHHVLRTADRAYVLENGRLVLEGRGEDLAQRRAAEGRLSRTVTMITDMHCHFVPRRILPLRRDARRIRGEGQARPRARSSTLDIRGNAFRSQHHLLRARAPGRANDSAKASTARSCRSPRPSSTIISMRRSRSKRRAIQRCARGGDRRPTTRSSAPGRSCRCRIRPPPRPSCARCVREHRLCRRPRRLQRARRLSARCAVRADLSRPRPNWACRFSSIRPIRPARSERASTS